LAKKKIPPTASGEPVSAIKNLADKTEEKTEARLGIEMAIACSETIDRAPWAICNASGGQQ
jgi:hypothetical protein